MGAPAMASEHDLEDQLNAQLTALQRELGPLELAAGDAANSLHARNAEVEQAHGQRVSHIDKRLLDATNEDRVRAAELNEAREIALEAQTTPVRLQEITVEKRGALEAIIARPVESEAARADLDRARTGLAEIEERLKQSTNAVHDAEANHRAAKAEVETGFGLSREQIQGRTVRELLGESAYRSVEPQIRACWAARPSPSRAR
jgi:chromosome segregation ATPase